MEESTNELAEESSASKDNHQKRSKFRFKSSKRSDSSRRDGDRDYSNRKRSQRYGEPTEDRSRKRRKESPSHLRDDPSLYDDTYLPNSRSSNYLDPDEAFRESLFDALADDEGAAYWEGVYGQPMHVYPDTKQGPDGELERMTDEEYATYVRNRMWEKSHEHLLEERKRREEERRKRKAQEQERAKFEEQHSVFDSMIDDALKRGQRRKKERAWADAWESYTKKWESLLTNGASSSAGEPSSKSDAIPWPVRTGLLDDISKETVQEFFRHSPDHNLAAHLKLERVRWHPDKMQQRSRGQILDETIIQNVTAVFQIIDEMWSSIRSTD